jgi:ABC-type transport system substrate-binding protein
MLGETDCPAAEYALDKPAIAKALGFGYYVPKAMFAPPGEWGFDQTNRARTYDPAQSRKLLSEAGYPNGLKTNILVMSGPANVAAATAIKRYMDDAGFQVDLDVADSGRFFGSAFRTGWKDLIWINPTSTVPNFLISFQRYFGHDPLSPYASRVLPPELKNMSEESVTLDKEPDQKAMTTKIVRYMTDQALTIPVYAAPNAYMTHPGVHIDYPMQGMGTLKSFDVWMEKH